MRDRPRSEGRPAAPRGPIIATLRANLQSEQPYSLFALWVGPGRYLRIMLAMGTTRHHVPPVEVDTLTVRQIAIDALADPRTVRRALRGEFVRGYVGERIRAQLIALGLRACEEPACVQNR